jgi:hypothetical protein
MKKVLKFGIVLGMAISILFMVGCRTTPPPTPVGPTWDSIAKEITPFTNPSDVQYLVRSVEGHAQPDFLEVGVGDYKDPVKTYIGSIYAFRVAGKDQEIMVRAIVGEETKITFESHLVGDLVPFDFDTVNGADPVQFLGYLIDAFPQLVLSKGWLRTPGDTQIDAYVVTLRIYPYQVGPNEYMGSGHISYVVQYDEPYSYLNPEGGNNSFDAITGFQEVTYSKALGEKFQPPYYNQPTNINKPAPLYTKKTK